MATVTKDFKVKSGLVVEGANATVGGYDVLKKDNATDEAYIVSLIGGTATAENTPDTVVKRDSFGNFAAGEITAALQGNVTGDVDGTVSDISNHNTDGLSEGSTNRYFTDQRALDATAAAYDAAGDAAQALVDANSYTDGRETAITTAYQAYADTAESDAITTAAADATAKANAAEASANSYTDDEISELDLALKTYADQAEADAVTSANSYTDGRETAITTAYQAYADQAEVDAKAYADQKVTDLIGGAPGILDTLNELAEAIGDDANFITTIEDQIALKADLTYVNDELSDLNSEAQGFADAAETAANEYTDGKITQEVADRNGAISTAITTEIGDRNTAINAAIAQEVIDRNSAITTAVDAIDTDDIEEGVNNEYFTDERATDAVALAIAAGSHENIAISYSNGAFSFQAENGVADSTTTDLVEGTNLYFTNQRAIDAVGGTIGEQIDLLTTDDIEEGTNNLYFTDARAVSALEAVVPNFTEIDLNEVATQVAASSTGDATQNVVAYQFATADYRSAKFLVKVAYGTHTEVSEVLLTLDTSDNVAITEYAIVGTNGSAAAVSADVSGGNVRLLVTPTNNGSTIKVMGTLLV
jgi:hypothetical protein